MNIIKNIYKIAKNKFSMIVLPEAATCERVLKAGLSAAKMGLAKIIILGGENEKKYGNSNIKVIDINAYENYAILKSRLLEKRSSKGLTEEDAEQLLKDPIYFATMLVECGYADGMGAGAITETANVFRPALQIIKGREGVKTISSSMILTDKSINNKANALLLSDIAMVENPSGEQLAEIAIETARTCKDVLEMPPVVAFLSYTTKSGKEVEVNKTIKEAMKILDEKNVDFVYDGEMQVDAALDSVTAAIKAPDSPVKGAANCLIFPNIVAGNIGYKLMRTSGRWNAIGPICQGLNKPISDVSRGATEEEILITIALTASKKNI